MQKRSITRDVLVIYSVCALGFGFAFEGAMALIADRRFSALEAMWVGAAWGALFFLAMTGQERLRRRSESEP